MIDTAMDSHFQQIVVDEIFPHSPAAVWKALTTPELMGCWLKMEPRGLEPVVGNRFTYQTTPAGKWDGTIQCEVVEVVPNERFAYTWKGGDEANDGAYGSRLDTLVTFTLEPTQGGTRLRAMHSGFVLPRNETAYRGMSGGWSQVVPRIGEIAGEQTPSK